MTFPPGRAPVALRIAIASLASLLLAAGCTGGDEDAPAPRIPAGNATVAALLPTDAAELPEFDLSRYQSLIAQLEGTPVLVNFWGSWCAPCRDEAPHLAAAHAEFGDRVQFLGVDILDARGSARTFMREAGWTYPSVFDPPGAIRDGLGLLGQPVTLFYRADGELVDRWVGPIPAEELALRLDRIAHA